MAEQQQNPSWTYIFFLTAKVSDNLGLAMRYLFCLGCARYIYLSVVELAGKTTVANVMLTYITGQGKAHLLPWAVSGASLIWGYIERHLRLKKIAAMGNHNAALEKRLDPTRSTSMLTLEGETTPGDHNL